MKAYKSLEYAFPTSRYAKALGHSKAGCWYIAKVQRKEDGSYAPGFVWPGTEGEATPDRDDLHLRSLWNEIDAPVWRYSQPY